MSWFGLGFDEVGNTLLEDGCIVIFDLLIFVGGRCWTQKCVNSRFMDAFRRLVDYIIILHTNTINKAFASAASKSNSFQFFVFYFFEKIGINV